MNFTSRKRKGFISNSKSNYRDTGLCVCEREKERYHFQQCKEEDCHKLASYTPEPLAGPKVIWDTEQRI